MSKEELPEAWRVALEPKGIDSIRGLAARAEVSPMAASRLVKGEGTSVPTVNAVAAKVFGLDSSDFVWELHGLSVKDYGPFALPEESSLLTEDQRIAVLAVVRAMLPPEVKRAGGASGRKRAAPKKQRRLGVVQHSDEQAAADEQRQALSSEQEQTEDQ